MGRRQGRNTYNKMNSNTPSPGPSPPPTPRPEHQKLEEAEENSLMNVIMKKLEARVEEKTKKCEERCKQLEERANKLEEINKVLEENNKILKENQEKSMKQMKETVQDLKKEIEKMKKTQTEGMLEIENLRKRLGTSDASIINRMQEMEERISSVEDTIEETWSL